MITLENLTISQGKHPILKKLSLVIQKGESVALMGLNGSGKSTLIKTLLGLHLNYTGTAKINGIPINDPMARTNISYLPEKFQAGSSITGSQYLRILLKNIPYQDISDQLDLSKITLDKKIKKYSKGMLQKLGLIHFFSQNKSIKIADEIMSGLDFKTRLTVQNIIKKQNNFGTTFLFTTHLQQDADHAANRLITIEKETITD